VFANKSAGLLLAPLLVMLSLPGAQAAGVTTLLDAGTRLYNQGNFKQAVVYFRQAANCAPDNAVVHFYLANALSWLGEKKQALKEYSLSTCLDPYGPASAYLPQPARAASAPLPNYVYSQLLASTLEQEKSADDVSVDGAMRRIRRQAAWEKAKQHMQAEDGANNIWRQNETETRRLEAHAQADIQRALTPPSTTLGHGTIFWDEAAAQREAAAIRQSVEDAKAMSVRFAQARADVYRANEIARQAQLDQTAANLKGQMEEPVIADGVRLLPEGTNLYVRNYADGSSLPDTGGGDTDKNPGKALTEDRAKDKTIDAIKGQKGRLVKVYYPHGQSANEIEDLRYTKEVKAKRLD
jgi:tetratricopeptide (TPR) repeat protein